MASNLSTFRLSLRTALSVFICSRLLILTIVVCAIGLKTPTIAAREGINYNTSIEINSTALTQKLEKVFLSADGSWYKEIAETGYDKGPFSSTIPHNWVFFPLFPILLKAVSTLTGETLSAGLLISNLCLFFSLVLLHQLALMLALSSTHASRMLWFLAFFPTSYFFSAPITESLFLLLSLLAFYSLFTNRPLSGAFWMFFCCLSRPTGLLVYPAYAWKCLSQEASLPKKVIPLLLPLVGPLLFMLHLHTLTGNALAWIENQEAWGRPNSAAMLLEELLLLPDTLMVPWNFLVLNFLSGALSLSAAVYFARRNNTSWTLFLALPVLVTLSTGTLQSLTRIIMPLFPLYFALSRWSENEVLEKLMLVIFSALLALMTALWAVHGTGVMA